MKKADREAVFNKYGGKCAYCGCQLPDKGWHADHIEAIVRDFVYVQGKGFQTAGTCEMPENDVLENMNPACASCNIQKNSFSLEQFRENIKLFVNSLNTYSTQYKFAKRYGLIKETEIDVKFYFETL